MAQSVGGLAQWLHSHTKSCISEPSPHPSSGTEASQVSAKLFCPNLPMCILQTGTVHSAVRGSRAEKTVWLGFGMLFKKGPCGYTWKDPSCLTGWQDRVKERKNSRY